MAKRKPRRPLKKLVRDKIPEEIRREGRSFRRFEVTGDVRGLLLRRKAVEEVLELCNAHEVESIKEELADVFEVLHALAAEHQIPIDDIESIRIAKRLARGGFDKGIFIDYVAPAESDLQAGLFGPMDYVSLTKDTPRIKELKIDRQQLLRIPLAPTHYQEEFKVGNYTVIYTDREVLVRIAPTRNDSQLSLFPHEQEFYELSSASISFSDVIGRFQGFWKIYSNILLRMHGFPIPESLLLLTLTPETKGALFDFCHRHNYTRVLVRHDRNPETTLPPRGVCVRTMYAL